MERKNTDSFSSVSVPGPVRIEANITYTNIGIDLRFQTVVPSTEGDRGIQLKCNDRSGNIRLLLSESFEKRFSVSRRDEN